MTPGDLEKHLARPRVPPGTGKYERYGILMALAEVGVLPNTVIDTSFDRFIPQQEYLAAHAALPVALRSRWGA